MNTSRIEVPLKLPPPHFDDERTIATARQVEPIGRAKVTDTWRKMRTLLPLLFLATVCGALGAAAVNYYERKPESVVLTAAPSQPTIVAPQVKSEPTPLAIAASDDVNGSKALNESKPREVEQTATTQDAPSVQPEPKPTRDNGLTNVAPDPPKKSVDSDAAKLTRKRRVQPVDDSTPRAQKNGAARISDIFSGPNP